MPIKELIAATNNAHKLEEIKAILEPHGIKVYSLKEKNIHIEVEENGSTYLENALLKANAIKPLTDLAIISDDSGIEIEAMDNMPGIHSARYADSLGGYYEAFQIIQAKCREKNNYRATFYCTIVLLNYENEPVVFKGIVPGRISDQIIGRNGFGFDPLFIADETGVTNASLLKEEKNLHSARSKALFQLIDYVK